MRSCGNSRCRCGRSLQTALIIGGGYGAGATFLTRPALRFDISFAHSATCSGSWRSQPFLRRSSRSPTWASWSRSASSTRSGLRSAALRYWIGDMIGITVVTPFILILFTHRRIRVVTWEVLGPLALIVAALWLTMQLRRARAFSLVLSPVHSGDLERDPLWPRRRGVRPRGHPDRADRRHPSSPSDAIDVTAFQALMIVLAVTGLAVGLLVNEQQRTEQQLRAQQDAIARVIRIGSMGEFAAALAHEINQPLMAIANYTKLAKEVAEKTPVDTATVAEASGEGRRTGRARRRGGAPPARVHPARPQRGGRGACRAGDRAGAATLRSRSRTARASRSKSTHRPGLPFVLVDSLQVQQVIINLVRNASRCHRRGRTLRRPHLHRRPNARTARQRLRSRQWPGSSRA